MNSLQSKKIQFSVTISINSIENRPNSSCLTEYRSYLHCIDHEDWKERYFNTARGGILCTNVINSLCL